MIIELLSGPPGCGKTASMRAAAIAESGKYLFALPTIALIKEQAAATRLAVPLVTTIELHAEARDRRGPVKDRLAALPSDVGEDDHVIAYCTHETLMAADLSAFEGWHLRIDEVPQAINAGVIAVAESVGYFAVTYSLHPLEGSAWSEVRRIGAHASWKAINQDDLARPVAEFSKLSARPAGLYVHAHSWDEVRDRGALAWISLWTPLALDAFRDVQLVAANPLRSLCVRAWTSLLGEEVTLRERALPYRRLGWPKVQIHYYAGGHEGSTAFWATPIGAECLGAVSRHLESVASLDYWSANESIRLAFAGRLLGESVAPKLAGLNFLRDRKACALIYSAKSTPGDAPLYDLLGLAAGEVRRAREDEDVAQFALRGAIRDLDYAGPYDVYLYSRRQAEALQAYLLGGVDGFHQDKSAGEGDERGVVLGGLLAA